ncbi:MAG TPA: hypothetical protein VE595_03635 [Nitrososphaeraceae archaeon]|jgi:hypothetical protein|nr:hypothetical protein [Nitrososphaeraceae archaeon]HYZ96284.1 hypothetical protein [Nitrososphaeraceae archaeon]
MNRLNILIVTAIVMVIGTAFLGLHSAVAQYGGDTAGSLEEQLKLAQEKLSVAGQEGAYGSGTSMVTADTSQTAIFIGILVAIFGGVAAAFFIMSRSRQRQPARY